MNALENIGKLLDNLGDRIEGLLSEREKLLAEISDLRERLAQCDEEAVKAARSMRAELEAAKADALRFEYEHTMINTKLQGLNDRLVALAGNEKRVGS